MLWLMSLFNKLCLTEGLVWTIGLTVEIKLCSNSYALTYEPFQQALFYWGISVDDRPNRRNKAVCSNSYVLTYEPFQQALLSWGISVDDRPNRRNKAVCSNSYVLTYERFQQALLSWGISVDDRPNRRNKAVFKFLCFDLWAFSTSSVLLRD